MLPRQIHWAQKEGGGGGTIHRSQHYRTNTKSDGVGVVVVVVRKMYIFNIFTNATANNSPNIFQQEKRSLLSFLNAKLPLHMVQYIIYLRLCMYLYMSIPIHIYILNMNLALWIFFTIGSFTT